MELALGFIMIAVFIELRERKLMDKMNAVESKLVTMKTLQSHVGMIEMQLKDLEQLSSIAEDLSSIKMKMSELLKEAEQVAKYRSSHSDAYDVEL